MSLNKETIIIHLLGRPYPIVCPANEAAQLKAAAAYLEQKLHGWVRTNAHLSMERIAFMAGLELAHECLTKQVESSQYESTIVSQLRDLTAALDKELC